MNEKNEVTRYRDYPWVERGILNETMGSARDWTRGVELQFQHSNPLATKTPYWFDYVEYKDYGLMFLLWLFFVQIKEGKLSTYLLSMQYLFTIVNTGLTLQSSDIGSFYLISMKFKFKYIFQEHKGTIYII